MTYTDTLMRCALLATADEPAAEREPKNNHRPTALPT